MIKITAESVRAGLLALVKQEGGDFIYTPKPPTDDEEGQINARCVYVHQGKPDCIVGRFLHGQGVSLEVLTEADKYEFGGGLSAIELINRLRDGGVISMTPEAARALTTAQYEQDQLSMWGVAVERALRYIPSPAGDLS
jgi:hypothetical protein